jgi:hypothetical protein
MSDPRSEVKTPQESEQPESDKDWYVTRRGQRVYTGNPYHPEYVDNSPQGKRCPHCGELLEE